MAIASSVRRTRPRGGRWGGQDAAMRGTGHRKRTSREGKRQQQRVLGNAQAATLRHPEPESAQRNLNHRQTRRAGVVKTQKQFAVDGPLPCPPASLHPSLPFPTRLPTTPFPASPLLKINPTRAGVGSARLETLTNGFHRRTHPRSPTFVCLIICRFRHVWRHGGGILFLILISFFLYFYHFLKYDFT